MVPPPGRNRHRVRRDRSPERKCRGADICCSSETVGRRCQRNWILLVLAVSSSGLAGCHHCKDIADEHLGQHRRGSRPLREEPVHGVRLADRTVRRGQLRVRPLSAASRFPVARASQRASDEVRERSAKRRNPRDGPRPVLSSCRAMASVGSDGDGLGAGRVRRQYERRLLPPT